MRALQTRSCGNWELVLELGGRETRSRTRILRDDTAKWWRGGAVRTHVFNFTIRFAHHMTSTRDITAILIAVTQFLAY